MRMNHLDVHLYLRFFMVTTCDFSFTMNNLTCSIQRDMNRSWYATQHLRRHMKKLRINLNCSMKHLEGFIWLMILWMYMIPLCCLLFELQLNLQPTKSLDLHSLFKKVAAFGGYGKVVKEGKWIHILDSECINSSLSVQVANYYKTLLSHYEKAYLLKKPGWTPIYSEPLQQISSASQVMKHAEQALPDTGPIKRFQVICKVDEERDNGFAITVMVESKLCRGVVYRVQ